MELENEIKLTEKDIESLAVTIKNLCDRIEYLEKVVDEYKKNRIYPTEFERRIRL